jgi:DNA-directed RNA polymerase specialized sigma24 family protein
MNASPSPARGASEHAAELLEAHIPGLRRYAYALLCGDREGADDLVQDSLERALSCWHQRRNDGDLRGSTRSCTIGFSPTGVASGAMLGRGR